MVDQNSVNFTGRLTADPEVTETPNGYPVVSFRIAINGERRDPATGEWVEQANYVSVVWYGNVAAAFAKGMRKGTRVAVSAAIRYSEWEKDGQKRSKVDFVADHVYDL